MERHEVGAEVVQEVGQRAFAFTAVQVLGQDESLRPQLPEPVDDDLPVLDRELDDVAVGRVLHAQDWASKKREPPILEALLGKDGVLEQAPNATAARLIEVTIWG